MVVEQLQVLEDIQRGLAHREVEDTSYLSQERDSDEGLGTGVWNDTVVLHHRRWLLHNWETVSDLSGGDVEVDQEENVVDSEENVLVEVSATVELVFFHVTQWSIVKSDVSSNW